MTNDTTTAPKAGAGALKRKGDALRARALAEQAAAKAKFLAGLPGAAPTAPKAAAVAPAPQQQPAALPVVSVSVTTATPPAPPAASGADPEDAALLKQYDAMTGPNKITFFLQHEKSIRLARANQPSDTGRHRHLSGLDRTIAATRIAQP